jgi:hypothetical protein
MAMRSVADMAVSKVYPLYVTKVERKGHTKDELDRVIRWLTGYTQGEVEQHVANNISFQEFFDGAQLNPNASLITGTICGVKVQEIEDPLMQKVRYLDKLVDEVANGRPMEKILRK